MATTRSFKTAKGTELPLLNLKGKEYLEVKYRLVWFREDHPTWSIETELMAVTDVSAYAKATVRDEEGRTIATSHKFERIQGFPDFIEKAETGAIGRALALIGYGTQFCADELEASVENKATATPGRNAQSAAPAPRAQAAPAAQAPPPKAAVAAEAPVKQAAAVQAPVQDFSGAKQNEADIAESSGATVDFESEDQDEAQIKSGFQPGDFLINFGRKYKGKKLKEIPKSEIESYIKWLETSDVRPGTALSHQVEHLKSAFGRMYKAETAS